MSRTSTPIAGGTTGSLADAAPAIDRIAGIDYQMVKLADATTDATGAIGIDSNPLKVKPRRYGTADYDSGQVAAPSSTTAVTTATVYLETILITNASAAQRAYSLTDTAGNTLIDQLPIAPRETRVLPLGGMAITGIKHFADAGSAVRVQIRGAQ
jgi:hypothetical protein